jgi:addiction module RelB/DinJ family antitoxin
LTGQTCQPSAEFDSKPILKHDAEKVFRESGLTATQAIALCWKQVEIEGALPFAVRVPNDVTIGADAAEAPPESASGSRLGTPAGVSAPIPKRADAGGPRRARPSIRA